jgi:hypothetical protein
MKIIKLKNKCLINYCYTYLLNVAFVENFYSAAQNDITQTNRTNCITEHIKSKHCGDITK